MAPRVRLVLIAWAACAAAAAVGIVLAQSAGEETGAAGPGPSGFQGSVRPPGARAPEFSLRDQDGKLATMASLRGQPVIFTFVYSTCQDTCPIMVQQIRGALDDLGEDVPVIGVSVDPASDTPRRARRFLLEQRMTGRMRYLLGTRAELAPIWKAFGIAPEERDLSHSSYVVLVDGRGRQRVGFPYGQLSPEGLAHDVARLG